MAKLCLSLQHKNLENTAKFGKLENLFKNSLTFMELFGEFKGLICERRKSSQIWEPFCKLKDIIYEEKT